MRITGLTSWIVLSMSSTLLHSQQTAVEALKALGRDSLISRAVNRLLQSDSTFDPTQYDRIRVTMDEKDVRIRFEHSISYYARKTAFKYGAIVSLLGRSTGSSIVSNPDDYDEDADSYRFFKWTRESRKAVQFVLDAINRNSEIGSIEDGQLPAGTTMEIREESGYYQISVDSWSTHSEYKVKKGSGKIYDASHKHHMRYDDNPEIELKP